MLTKFTSYAVSVKCSFDSFLIFFPLLYEEEEKNVKKRRRKKKHTQNVCIE